MQKGLAHLEAEGILYTKGTAGRFVTSDACVLARAREHTAKEMARHICEEAAALGLSRKKLIEYIEKEDILT